MAEGRKPKCFLAYSLIHAPKPAVSSIIFCFNLAFLLLAKFTAISGDIIQSNYTYL